MTMRLDIMRQFIIFCGVGVINTIAGLAVILLLSEIIGVHYIAANMAGYAFGLMIAFTLHRNITFKNAADPHKKRSEFFKFISVFALAYIVQLGALILMVRGLHLPQALAQILAIGIYTILNYLGNRMITFRSSAKDTA